ncbi:hypothetical protein [Sphingobium nicotianae]|uniref:Uncharacterized protein n=1 Tax=Sphingobium nicotianae TaxID=2782607 RepID=A0A9X1AIX2_9SPHN|nr:hypothetical protein [Sphingobium nicotianae]MBT2185476.1 hypothetical protein [Sphingobium nicotianae]
MARFRLALALVALGFSPAVADAQVKKPPVKSGVTPPTPAQMQRVASNFNVLMGALQSKDVPQVVKNVLFVCIYSNPFGKISEGADKAIDAKKVDRNNPNNVLGAMAGVCGLRPEMLQQQGQPPKK